MRTHLETVDCVRVCGWAFFEHRPSSDIVRMENLLPLRNVCQFYAKQNQNRKSLSSVSFRLPLRFLHRPETKEQNKIYDPLQTARLHMRMERKKEQKQCNSQKEKWRNEPLAVMFCVVCVWVPCFQWIFIFYFYFFGKEEKLRQLSTAKTVVNFMQFIIIVCLAGIWIVLRTIWLSAVVDDDGDGDDDDEGDILNQTNRLAKQLFHHFQ